VPPRPKVLAEMMSAHTLTTTPLADLADIAQDMIHHDVHSIPVLDNNGELVGVVSPRDIERGVVGTDETLAQEIQHRLDANASKAGRWQSA